MRVKEVTLSVVVHEDCDADAVRNAVHNLNQPVLGTSVVRQFIRDATPAEEAEAAFEADEDDDLDDWDFEDDDDGYEDDEWVDPDFDPFV